MLISLTLLFLLCFGLLEQVYDHSKKIMFNERPGTETWTVVTDFAVVSF